MTQTVVGIFKTTSEAQAAVNQLLANGFTSQNVDISSGSSTSTSNVSSTDEHESGIKKFFRELFGGDNDETDRYTNAGKRGSIVTVHANSTEEANRAMSLLDEYGAVDVDEDNSQYGSGSYGSDAAGSQYTTGGFGGDLSSGRGQSRSGLVDDDVSQSAGDSSTTRSRDDLSENVGQSIPVIEENLVVGKREVETGGVRLRSRLIEKPVQESLRLREEHVRVERTPVDRVASETDLENFKEGTIEVTEYAEVPLVSKEARIVEEVSLDKKVEHREETISDTVRSTEVDVENIDSDSRKRSDSDSRNTL